LQQKYGFIEGFKAEHVNPVSYDITLDPVIEVEDPLYYRKLQLYKLLKPIFSNLPEPKRFYTLALDKPFLLKPGRFVLASSAEIFHLPENIAAKFLLKSSRAREGYAHMLAGWCEPTWNNSKLTLELYNPTCTPVPLYPGLRIGQMIFATVRPSKKAYKDVGHYNGDKSATPSIHKLKLVN